MSEQIKIFKIPFSDLSNPNFSITINDPVASDIGTEIIPFMRNRNLTSAWSTTGSNDSANTEIVCELSDSPNINDIFLIGHNLKDFTVEYFDGTNYVLLDTVSGNTDDFYHLNLDYPISSTIIRFTITGTITADDDKRITRLMIVERMLTGQFQDWLVIQDAEQSKIKKKNQMLSGKYFISDSVGAFTVTLRSRGITNQGDIDIIEQMFLSRSGFMLWLSGGDEAQFRFKLTGYRRQDFYIMKPERDYIAEYYKGLYRSVVPQNIRLVETV